MIDYEESRRHVRLACDFLRLSPEQAERLQTAHETALRRSDADAFVYEDGSADTPAWLRHVEQTRPDLVGKAPKPASPAEKAQNWAVATFGELFVGIKGGSAAAAAELERRSREGDGTPSAPPAPAKPLNITMTMAKAKAGDASARAALTHFFGR